MDRRILLVGNGPSVLDAPLGPAIDSFQRVVRFNGFVLRGFEDKVGTRTTIWSRWYGLETLQPMESLEEIWINMPVHERTETKLARAFDYLGEYRKKARVIPTLEVATELQLSLFGGPHPTAWPSSGLLALAHALQGGFEVWIAGFDSWTREPFHYYGPHDRSGSHHRAEVEAAHIATLIRDGKVRPLWSPR